jgi:hypothetical protein
MNRIAAEFGYTAPTSGKKLKDQYNDLIDPIAKKKALKKYAKEIQPYLK